MTLRGPFAQTTLKILIAAVILLTCGVFAYWMYSHATGAQQTADGSVRVSKLRTVGSALETYRAANTRYPDALGALLEQDGERTYLSRPFLDQPGYSYDYKPSPDNFALQLKPDSGRGAYFLTDNSGQVRVSLNAPATDTSPLWNAEHQP